MQMERRLQEYYLSLGVKEFAEGARVLSFSGCDYKSFLSCKKVRYVKNGKFCYRFGLFNHNGCQRQ